MLSCLVNCVRNKHSKFKMHSIQGTSSGPTAVISPLFKNSPYDIKIRSLIGTLTQPSRKYEKGILSHSVDQTDHPGAYSHDEAGYMLCESDRIKTFENWPVSFLSPEQVASNGFYYLGHGDVVCCAFCKVKILKWIEGDDPAIEHRRWSPQCPFVCKFKGVKNASGQDECGSRVPTITPTRYVGPSNPFYSSKAARLSSFESWPRCMRQKPEDLAEAGLYYTGKGDETKCFHCDGGLKNWEDDDVPWEQHARWFDKCTYVQLMKGRDYIQKVLVAASAIPKANTKDLIKEEPPCKAKTPTETEKPSCESKQCIICCENARNVCFVPCGHVVTCAMCASTVDKCPVCRSMFQSAVRLYFS